MKARKSRPDERECRGREWEGTAIARRRERGAVLLVVVLVVGAVAGASASLVARAAALARETASRRDALCARQAALGGLALGAPTAGDGSAAALVGGRADSLVVERVARSPSWCVLRSTAACGSARRTAERTLPDPAACGASP